MTPPHTEARDVPLLTTKLYIPPPLPNLVERPRLVKRLAEGLTLGRRLTLISAPAGFGKTTLVSEWVQTMGEATSPVAVAPGPPARTGWLFLDEGDNDLPCSLNTVKVHTRNIYAKLGAHHRAGAVARVRALGVLSRI